MKEEKMKIIVLKQTVAAKVVVRPGDVIDVSDADGKYLIGAKKAVKHDAASAKEHEKLIAEAAKRKKAKGPADPPAP